MVEVLHAPHPKLLGLLLVGGEHFFCGKEETEVSNRNTCGQPYTVKALRSRPDEVEVEHRCEAQQQTWLFAKQQYRATLRKRPTIDWKFSITGRNLVLNFQSEVILLLKQRLCCNRHFPHPHFTAAVSFNNAQHATQMQPDPTRT